MRKKLVIILDICIVLVIIAACVLGKKAFDRYKTEKQQASVAEKQVEIQNLQTAFEQETDRAKKLELLKSTQDSYEAYQKEKEPSDACVAQYESVLVAEKKYFEDDYNNVITANSIADVAGETDREKLNTCIVALTELKNTIQTEYDTYSVITEAQLTAYNTQIDGLVTAYTGRMSDLDEEELQKQQADEQEEQQKKAQEQEKKTETSTSQSTATTTKKKNSSTSSNSSRSSSSSSSSSRNNNSSTNSNSNSDSSSGSSSNGTGNNDTGNHAGNTNNSDTNPSDSSGSGSGLGDEEGGYWYIDPDTGELYR